MSSCSDFLVIDTKQKTKCRLHIADILWQNTSTRQAVYVWCKIVACSHYSWHHGTVTVFLLYCWATYVGAYIQRVSKRMTRFQRLISNKENVLQLQNKLQTIK